MEKEKEIATERIEILFKEAANVFKKSAERANRYVGLARKIAMKARIRMPGRLKRKFCKHCHRYLQPGVNCRVRNHKSRIIYYCINCKKYTRFQLRK